MIVFNQDEFTRNVSIEENVETLKTNRPEYCKQDVPETLTKLTTGIHF